MQKKILQNYVIQKKKVKGYIDAVSIDNENNNFFLSKYLVNKNIPRDASSDKCKKRLEIQQRTRRRWKH